MKKIEQAELEVIKKKHKLWREGKAGGERADLSYCDCSGLDFSGANMTRANFFCADMTGAIMDDVNLTGAKMTGVSMTCVDIVYANLTDAILYNVDMAYSVMTGANMTRTLLTHANMAYAKMTDVNLTDASMAHTDMTGATFWGTIGNGREIKSDQISIYEITYTAHVLQIGCEQHPIKDWWEFDEDRIYRMDGQQAVDFWHKYKDTIKQMIEASPAKPTKG